MTLPDQETNLAEPPAQDISMRERNMTLLLSLFLILLAFFIQMTAVSSKNPSRVDSAVSSISETFGKSAKQFDEGALAATSGTRVNDLPYLDAVANAANGSESLGEVTSSRREGTLTLRLARERLFVLHTGIVHSEGNAFVRKLADAMIAGDNSAALRSVEIRLSATAGELAANVAQTADQAVPIRQLVALAVAMTGAGIKSAAISASVIPGAAPIVEMRFYSIEQQSTE